MEGCSNKTTTKEEKEERVEEAESDRCAFAATAPASRLTRFKPLAFLRFLFPLPRSRRNRIDRPGNVLAFPRRGWSRSRVYRYASLWVSRSRIGAVFDREGSCWIGRPWSDPGPLDGRSGRCARFLEWESWGGRGGFGDWVRVFNREWDTRDFMKYVECLEGSSAVGDPRGRLWDYAVRSFAATGW